MNSFYHSVIVNLYSIITFFELVFNCSDRKDDMKHTEKVNRPADADRLIDNFHLERDENHLLEKSN